MNEIATPKKNDTMATKDKGVFRGKKAFKKLEQLLANAPDRSDVRNEHEIGRLVEELCPIRESGYGSSRIETLAAELGDERPVLTNRLLNARRLFAIYTPKEFQQLVQRAEKKEYKLGISLLITFASMEDDKLRKEITTSCLEERWSVKKLRLEVQRRVGRRSGGGAKLLRPASAEDALADMSERAEEWLRRHNRIWFHGDDAVFAKDLSVQEAKRIAGQLEESELMLNELQQAVEHACQVLSKQRKRAANRKKKSRKR